MPACSGTVALEDHLAGQDVRCPFCSQPFRMPVAAEEAPPAIHTSRQPGYPQHGQSSAPAGAPHGQPASWGPSGGPGPYHPQLGPSYQPPDGAWAQRAKSKVMPPAICMMLHSGLMMMGLIVWFCLVLVAWMEVLDGTSKEIQARNVYLAVIFVLFLCQAFICYGGWRMYDLDGPTTALFVSILSMLCSCSIFGIPIGIWY